MTGSARFTAACFQSKTSAPRRPRHGSLCSARLRVGPAESRPARSSAELLFPFNATGVAAAFLQARRGPAWQTADGGNSGPHFGRRGRIVPHMAHTARHRPRSRSELHSPPRVTQPVSQPVDVDILGQNTAGAAGLAVISGAAEGQESGARVCSLSPSAWVLCG